MRRAAAGIAGVLAVGVVVWLLRAADREPETPASVRIADSEHPPEVAEPIGPGDAAIIDAAPFRSPREAEAPPPSPVVDVRVPIEGIVVGADGEPVSDARVVLIDDGFGATFKTGSEGRFAMQLRAAPSQNALLVANAAGFLGVSLILVDLPEGSRRSIRLVLSEGAAIEGVVLLDGRPAAGVELGAERPRRGGTAKTPGESPHRSGSAGTEDSFPLPGSWRASRQSDDAGAFRITGLEERDYVVSMTRAFPEPAHPDLELSRTLLAQIPATRTELRIETVTLEIRVYDGIEFRPGAEIEVRSIDDPRSVWTGKAADVIRDGDPWIRDPAYRSLRTATFESPGTVRIAPSRAYSVRATRQDGGIVGTRIGPFAVGARERVDVIIPAGRGGR